MTDWEAHLQATNGVGMREYNSVHRWLKKHCGKARYCQNKYCPMKDRRYSWALKRGCLYTRNKNNFLQLCHACHRKYDSKEAFVIEVVEKTGASFDTREAGRRGAKITNSILTTETRQKAARKAWRTRRKKKAAQTKP